MIASGYYLNGQSSQRIPCRAEFLPGTVRIAFVNNAGENENLYWNPALIHPHVRHDRDVYTLVYGEFPFQSLEVNHKDLNLVLDHLYPSRHFDVNRQVGFLSTSATYLMGILLGFLALAAIVYFVALPWGADQLAQHIPRSTEIALGEKLYESYTADMSRNEKASRHLNEFLGLLVDTTQFPVVATVVHSDVVNAFALPGGHMVVFDSIVKGMNSYGELAALLGHEYAHVNLHHSTRNMLRSLSSYAFISIALGDVGNVISVAAEQANTLNNLSYSREFETEADEAAIHLLQEKRIDLNGMLQMFEMLKRSGPEGVPDFLSTHPATDDRINRVKSALTSQRAPQKNQQLEELFNQIKADIADFSETAEPEAYEDTETDTTGNLVSEKDSTYP